MRVIAVETAGPSSDEILRYWTGNLLSPEFPSDLGATIPWLIEPQVSLSIRSGDHEVSTRLAREVTEAQSKSSGAFGPAQNLDGFPDDPARNRVFTKMKIRTLWGSWFVPARGTNIVIQPVEDDPRFHIIYEEDPDKVAQGGHVLPEEEAQKLRRARDFFKALDKERISETKTP